MRERDGLPPFRLPTETIAEVKRAPRSSIRHRMQARPISLKKRDADFFRVSMPNERKRCFGATCPRVI